MKAFTQLHGIAAPLLIDNVDTDAIIPSKETQSVSRSGYGEKLFSNWRYLPGTRVPNPDFVLNQTPFDQAVVLIGGRNFGCGSSREAAVWALVQFGIRAVIAESFGAIFRNNCIRNGVLPVALTRESLDSLMESLKTEGFQLTIDLHTFTIQALDLQKWNFEIGALDREMLLHGLDEIALTLKRRKEIIAFRDEDRQRRPWIYLPHRS
jgi:3-isopropylmalate/(R)-2-methylmalate dehydratase small subunit